MEVESVLVTGANREIGLEFVRQLADLPKPPRYIFATYRNKDTNQALKDIKWFSRESKVILIKMDAILTEDVENTRKIVEETVGDRGLNLLINNAGVGKPQVFPEVTEENLHFHFNTNTVGPIKVLKEMLPLLQKAAHPQEKLLSVSRAAVLNVSSSLASSGCNDFHKLGRAFSYAVSKAALNAAMRLIVQTIKDQGILVVNMCPGWVRTGIGSDAAELDVSESILSMLKTLSTLNESHQGSFLDRNGKTIPF